MLQSEHALPYPTKRLEAIRWLTCTFQELTKLIVEDVHIGMVCSIDVQHIASSCANSFCRYGYILKDKGLYPTASLQSEFLHLHTLQDVFVEIMDEPLAAGKFSIMAEIPPKGVSFSDLIAIFTMSSWICYRFVFAALR